MKKRIPIGHGCYATKILHQGNSVISVETHPDHSHPVVIKKPVGHRLDRGSMHPLEKEYEMTRSLNAVDGMYREMMKSFIASIIIVLIVFHSGQGMASGKDAFVFDRVRVGWTGAFGQGFIQDKDGFFWIGTLGALYKWNGIGLVSYTPVNSGLSDGMITAVLEDKDGMIWVGTLNGLNKYDKNTDRFISYKHNPNDPNTISHNTIGSQVQPQTLLEDSSGVLWIGTQNGLNKYNKDSNTFTCYLNDAAKDTSISHNIVSAIYERRR